MSKHTPGPWISGEYDDSCGYDCMTGGISIGPRGNGPVHLDGANYGQERCKAIKPEALERMEADAILIAAAPDLLEALKMAAQQLETDAIFMSLSGASGNHQAEAALAARAAIAKATGEVNV